MQIYSGIHNHNQFDYVVYTNLSSVSSDPETLIQHCFDPFSETYTSLTGQGFIEFQFTENPGSFDALYLKFSGVKPSSSILSYVSYWNGASWVTVNVTSVEGGTLGLNSIIFDQDKTEGLMNLNFIGLTGTKFRFFVPPDVRVNSFIALDSYTLRDPQLTEEDSYETSGYFTNSNFGGNSTVDFVDSFPKQKKKLNWELLNQDEFDSVQDFWEYATSYNEKIYYDSYIYYSENVFANSEVEACLYSAEINLRAL